MVRLQAWARDFSLLRSVLTDSGAHAGSCSTGTGEACMGVNLPESEPEQSPSSVSTFPCGLMAN